MLRKYIVFLFIILSCTASYAIHDIRPKVLEAVEGQIPVLSEMKEMYSTSTFKYMKLNGRHVVEGRVLITPYYKLSVIVPIKKPDWREPLTPAGLTEISLSRITKIDYEPKLKVVTPHFDIHPKVISTSDWMHLVKNNGKLKEIDIHLHADDPMPNLLHYLNELEYNADIK